MAKPIFIINKRVISRKNLPTESPTIGTLVLWLLLDRLAAPGWVWGLVGTLVVVGWILFIASFFYQEEVDVLK